MALQFAQLERHRTSPSPNGNVRDHEVHADRDERNSRQSLHPRHQLGIVFLSLLFLIFLLLFEQFQRPRDQYWEWQQDEADCLEQLVVVDQMS